MTEQENKRQENKLLKIQQIVMRATLSNKINTDIAVTLSSEIEESINFTYSSTLLKDK